MKVGDKVKIVKDIPSVNGMLYKNSIVKIDEIDMAIIGQYRGTIRVTDSLGQIWWVRKEDITNV